MDTMLLFFLMVLGYSLHALFNRLYVASYEGSKPEMLTPLYSVINGAIVALASFIAGGFTFAPSWQTVLLGLLNAVVLIMFNISIIEVGKRGPYSLMMVFNLFGCILIPLFVGVFFWGEQLSTLRIIAIICMLLALVLMTGQKIITKGATKQYYFWCMVLFISNGVFGTIQNIQVQVMNGAERSEMLIILYGSSALYALIPPLLKGQGRELCQGLHMGKKAWIYLLLDSLFKAMAVNLLLFILNKMSSGILYTMDNGAVLVLSLIYALILFKEKPNKMQITGMVLAVLSIVMINLP